MTLKEFDGLSEEEKIASARRWVNDLCFEHELDMKPIGRKEMKELIREVIREELPNSDDPRERFCREGGVIG